jgi:glycosyltransferase involved in cell wall biosynthesis
VEWFSASFPGAPARAEIDGITVIRGGQQWSVHLEAIRRYRRRLRGRFDLVIDEVNTVPFFTPLWADIPSAMLIYQLAREVWWYESPFPLNTVGYALEPLYLRAYRRTAAFTISESTRDDLRRYGLRAPITVVPIAIEEVRQQAHDKEPVPTFVYVGRLAPSKRVHEILDAFARFRVSNTEARLWLVGEGTASYESHLRDLTGKLGIAGCVDFLGRLSAELKHERMARSHALLMASAREGWGLVVTEAGCCGTPALVYDVAGLRDSVRDGETGMVVPPGPQHLAAAMTRIWLDPALRQRLGEGARQFSQGFSYERSAAVLRGGILSLLP